MSISLSSALSRLRVWSLERTLARIDSDLDALWIEGDMLERDIRETAHTMHPNVTKDLQAELAEVCGKIEASQRYREYVVCQIAMLTGPDGS